MTMLTPNPISARPAVNPALVDAALARIADLSQAEIALAQRIIAASEDAAQAAEAHAELAFARGQLRAASRARDYLAQAANAGRVVATQRLDGSWSVIGSQGDRYTVRRAGSMLVCDCRHGQRVASGEPAAGVCWHAGALIPAIEEAQDEAADEEDVNDALFVPKAALPAYA